MPPASPRAQQREKCPFGMARAIPRSTIWSRYDLRPGGRDGRSRDDRLGSLLQIDLHVVQVGSYGRLERCASTYSNLVQVRLVQRARMAYRGWMPRDTLTREEIVRSAIELMDAEGLEGLNMRALG